MILNPARANELDMIIDQLATKYNLDKDNVMLSYAGHNIVAYGYKHKQWSMLEFQGLRE